jgi:type II secretory pathway component PulL
MAKLGENAMNTWMIWFKGEGETQALYQWELDQLKLRGEFTLEEIAAKTQGDTVLGFFPSERVTFVETVLPPVAEKKLRLAIPHLIEDHLASHIDENFYALPVSYQGGEPTGVGVISLNYLRNLLDACKAAGIHLQSLTADCFLVPTPREGMSKIVCGDRVVVRSGPSSGFALKQEHAVLIMKELESLVPVQPGLFEISPFNFLQGQFMNKPPKKSWGMRQWIFVTLGLALILHLVALLVMGAVLNHRLADLKEKSLTLYTEVVPGATKVSSAKSLIERELSKHGTASYDPLLDLLAALSSALTQTQGAVLNHLDYHQNRLSVNLSLPSLDALEQLDQALKESQTPPQDQQITEQGDAVLVQFRLSTGEGT